MRRLYRGETNIAFIGSRKRWYLTSAVLITLCLASMIFRQFEFGIEFSGGASFTMSKAPGTTVAQAERAAETTGIHVQTAQTKGTGANAKYVLKTAELNDDQVAQVKQALAKELDIPVSNITNSQVSPAWGGEVTRQAFIGLAVFLLIVSAYLWMRFEQKMAIAAMLALLHDLIFTAGIYSMIGFEVTPATVVGLLTILGFSLYDTVVVFDKVAENTKGILGGTRTTYAEASNLAVNQTLMRSINTSLISLLPVGGLLFVGAGLLGVGTLKDLALVLFVGLATGAYSSLFLATPWLVDLKEREPRYQALKQRVTARRASIANQAKVAAAAVTSTEPEVATAGASAGGGGGSAPRMQPRRQSPKGKPGRPSGSKRKR